MIQINSKTDFEGCQLYCVPGFAYGAASLKKTTLMGFIKSSLAYPWNQYVKKWLKRAYYTFARIKGLTKAQKTARSYIPDSKFKER